MASGPRSQGWYVLPEAAAVPGAVQTQQQFLPWRAGDLKRPRR